MPRPRPASPPPRGTKSPRPPTRPQLPQSHNLAAAAAAGGSALAVSLPALLAAVRHAKATPPDSVCARGVVCLPPSTMRAASLGLLDLVAVYPASSLVPSSPAEGATTPATATAAAAAAATQKNAEAPPASEAEAEAEAAPHIIVAAWPLDAVEHGFAALDVGSLEALAVKPVPASSLLHARARGAKQPATPSPARSRRKASAKSSSSRSRRASAPTFPPPRSPSSSAPNAAGYSSLATPPRAGRASASSQALLPSSPGGAVGAAAGDVELSASLRIVPLKYDAMGAASARAVHLAATDDGPALPDDDVLCAALRASLQGRVVRPETVVRATVLGSPRVLRVTQTQTDAQTRALPSQSPQILPANRSEPDDADTFEPVGLVRIVAETLISLPNKSAGGSAQSSMAPMVALAERVAGLDAQTSILRNAIEAILRQRQTNESLQLDESHSVRRAAPGALLRGTMGTGKTLLACAVAQESGAAIELVTAAVVAGADDGSSSDQASERVTALLEAAFARARRRQPSILLLDDVDVIAPRRDAADSDPAQAARTAVILTLVDTLSERRDRVFVLGTTARPDAVDPAVRRAGRLELDVELPVPDARARAAILAAHARHARSRNRVAATDAELAEVAHVAYGFVGADLAAAWRAAAARAQARCTNDDSATATATVMVTADDLRAGVRATRPSALRGMSVEVATTRWTDVGGMAAAKRRLLEAVQWPLSVAGAARLRAAGVTAPRGILLYGPPGCSKTMLARAVATEGAANFIAVKGAELLSKWVGESERAVQATFRRARQAAPCVIFFDEVDALAPARDSSGGGGGGGSAHARVVAQLLAEMDGVHQADESNAESRVVVIAATNRPDCLDAAFLRPGRIDVQVYVGLPDAADRLDILRVHTRHVPLAADVDLARLAADDTTHAFSGAELAAVVREAALNAMQRDVENAAQVDKEDFEKALGNVQPRTPPDLLAYFDRYNAGLRRRVHAGA